MDSRAETVLNTRESERCKASVSKDLEKEDPDETEAKKRLAAGEILPKKTKKTLDGATNE